MLYNKKKDFKELHRELSSTPLSRGNGAGILGSIAKSKTKTSHAEAYKGNTDTKKKAVIPNLSTNSLKQAREFINRTKSTISSMQSSASKPDIDILPSFSEINDKSITKKFTSPPTEKIGAAIKNNIKNVLSKKYSEPDTKHLFDDIDDYEIEKNIPTAENAIKTNIDRGYLNKDYFSKFPNLRDGLALSYAAAEKGNSKAATRAREAAYTEQQKPVRPTTLGYNASENGLPSVSKLLGTGTKPAVSLMSSDSKTQTRYVGGDGVRFRSSPDTSTSSNILGHFNTGDKVKFTGQKKEQGGRMWAEVVVDGKRGWVAAEYLKTAKPGIAGADSSESKDNKPETSETDKANRDENSSGIRFKAEIQKSGSGSDAPKEEIKPITPKNPYSDPQQVEMQQAVSYFMDEYDVTSEHARIMYYADQWKDVPEYKWTMGDIAKWITTGGDEFLHQKKLGFIENYKDVIKDAAEKNDIPPFLLAGVAYVEFGGDPMWFDDVGHSVRSFDWSGPDWVDENLTITKNPDLTSFGNISIQVRRALETLGYDTTTDNRDSVILSLKNPIQNIYISAAHLNDLKSIDYKDKDAGDLTDDEIKIIASRYNIGPHFDKNDDESGYSKEIYANKQDILNSLS